ncbi:Bacteriophage lambda head decoration protein D [Faunimonas pinastri]|uniref:Bacteriophage lambda head decoration protein D n=1 Tax=Faunimonas pinastri TaxID=1855383 RepID=A0A1H9QBN6_9HYPH|nr:head decoration protein [Faunimonas pinastri]SER57299.1 Bacteriophage lambda head decoration protein D [Faunimonas pinastri]
MAQVLVEGRRPTEFVMSEANFHRSRDNIVIAAGAGKLIPGTVVGKVTASKKYLGSATTATDGSETASAIILYGVDATDADAEVAAITRDAEVNGNILTYDASVTAAADKTTKIASLAEAGIIVR